MVAVEAEGPPAHRVLACVARPQERSAPEGRGVGLVLLDLARTVPRRGFHLLSLRRFRHLLRILRCRGGDRALRSRAFAARTLERSSFSCLLDRLLFRRLFSC